MKRTKLYFLLGALLFIFSCGDNNGGDPDKYIHHGFYEGIFPELSIERELILVYNGDTLTNKTVDVVAIGIAKPQGIFTFENVITGETKTVLTVDLIESEEPDNNDNSDPNIIIIHTPRLLFEGVYSTKSRSIKYAGFLEPKLLYLDLKED
jgi:hypothetical protein